MAEKYHEYSYKGLQELFDSLSTENRKLLTDYAQLVGRTDAKSVLEHTYDALTSGKGVSGYVTPKIDTEFTKKFEKWYDEHDVYTKQATYDKKYWTKDRIKEEYRRKAELNDFDSVTMADHNYLETVVNNHFIALRDAGAISKDGTRTDNYDALTKDGVALEGQDLIDAKEGLTGGKVEDLTDPGLNAMFKKYGLDPEKNKSLYDHLATMRDEDDMDDYQLEQFLQTDPAFIEKEYQENYDKYSDTITEAEKTELNILAGEDERTGKLLDIEFAKLVPELAALAKQYGGRTREDTFVSDTLTKARTDLEATRQNQLEIQRVGVRQGQAARKQLLESGNFENINEMTAEIAKTNLDNYKIMIEQQQKTQQTLMNISVAKSNMLAQRAQDRYNRDFQKELKRQQDAQTAASNAANKKARKLGAWVNPVIMGLAAAAAPMTAGGSFSLMAGLLGAGTVYGMQQTGTTAPNLQAMTTFGSNIGTGYYDVTKNWWDKPPVYGPQRPT